MIGQVPRQLYATSITMLRRTPKAAVTEAMTTEGHPAAHAVFTMNIPRLHLKDRAVLGTSFNKFLIHLEPLWTRTMVDSRKNMDLLVHSNSKIRITVA